MPELCSAPPYGGARASLRLRRKLGRASKNSTASGSNRSSYAFGVIDLLLLLRRTCGFSEKIVEAAGITPAYTEPIQYNP
jgi:hypothetical protein